MGSELEYPGANDLADWASLYLARGDEVMPSRPLFTGDIFRTVLVYGTDESIKKTVMIVQHPCALRRGSALKETLMVVEVLQRQVIPTRLWNGNFAVMPLPEMFPEFEDAQRHQAAHFDKVFLAKSSDLTQADRVACLSAIGVNLLLQRWVHHNSRVVVPTWQFQEVCSSVYEEADLIEEWCEERFAAGISYADGAAEVEAWLREDFGNGSTRQQMLKEKQSLSVVRRDLRQALKALSRS
jgi:hypothetical protein